MFLSIKKVPKTYIGARGKPFNIKPRFSTLFFLCFGLSLFGLGEGLLIVSFAGASPWSVLSARYLFKCWFFCWNNNYTYKHVGVLIFMDTP